MRIKKRTEPDSDFEVIESDWSDIVGKTSFTSGLTIIKCNSGYANIAINSHEHILNAGISFLLSDILLFQVLEVSSDFSVTCCRFSMGFCNDVYPMLDDKVVDVTAYSAPDLYTEQDLAAADLVIQQLRLLYLNQKHAYRAKQAKNLLIVYVLEIYEQTRPFIDTLLDKSSNYNTLIISRFYDLVQQNHLMNKNIQFYADRLNISSRYLNKISMKVLKMTPKELIDYYIIAEAKKMLLTSILTNQQIADKLNFSDQSAFGQYFKRNVGMSPSEYRQKYK